MSLKNFGGLLRAIYDAFFKGRKVKIGGAEIILPSQDNSPSPAGQSPLDSTPHKPGPPAVGPRR